MAHSIGDQSAGYSYLVRCAQNPCFLRNTTLATQSESAAVGTQQENVSRVLKIAPAPDTLDESFLLSDRDVETFFFRKKM